MNKMDSIEYIRKIAANMAEKLTKLSAELADKQVFSCTIQELIYQAGFIEGLCHGELCREEEDDEN